MAIQTMNDLQTILLNDKKRFEQLQDSGPFENYTATTSHRFKVLFDLLTQATSRNLSQVVNQLMIILADANTLDGDDTDKLDFFSSHVTGLIRHDIQEFARNHSRFTPENRNLQEKTEYLASLNAQITGTFIAPEVWM